MKKYIALCILLIAAAVYAIPPSPPYSLPSSITAEITGNVSGSAGNADKLDNHDSSYFQTAIDSNTDLTAKSFAGNGANLTGVDAATVDGEHASAFQDASGNLDILANITYQTFMQTLLGSANAGDARTNIGLGAADDVTFNSISGNGAALTGITVSGLRTDNASASHIPYIDVGGNVDDLELSGALTETGGTLTVRQLIDFTFADNDAAVTVAASKKGYVVPSAYNGSNVTEMTCSVYNRNSATANATIINLIRERAGNLTAIFTTGVNIAYASFFANATDTTANAALQTGDIILFGNVTAVAGPAPLGLICTFTITK
jgi:hypothetical protein